MAGRPLGRSEEPKCVRIAPTKAHRPELDACLYHLREGDVLTVWKLDRLACTATVSGCREARSGALWHR
ncbi:MAG: recombinase family protein [Actinobacteria bacterium]|nr:recombinase family protein [Actinomycetota bacterium]